MGVMSPSSATPTTAPEFFNDRSILFYASRDVEMLRILTGVMSVYRE